MKSFVVFLLMFALTLTITNAGMATEYHLTSLTHADLDQLISDVNETIADHHSTSSEEEEAVSNLIKAAAEEYFSAQGIAVTWAWHGYEYEYTQQWDFFSLLTHLDYKDAEEKNHQCRVYGEVFSQNGAQTVFYLQIDDTVVINKRAELPADLLLAATQHHVNEKLSMDLSRMSKDELNALKEAAQNEIKANHKTSGSLESQTNDLVKAAVEALFQPRGITLSWPWFGYTYTCDWGCYTESTSVSYTDEDGKGQKQKIYAEVYSEKDTYAVYYLTLDDAVVVDNREQLTEENSIRFYQSQQYAYGMQLMEEGSYSEAVTVFAKLGSFSDSALQRDICQSEVDLATYQKAAALYERGYYQEAEEIFLLLGTYSDSESRAALCEEQIKKLQYDQAQTLISQSDFEGAIEILQTIPDYSDSDSLISDCNNAIAERDYASAKALMDNGQYEEAIAAFMALGGYGDSSFQISACQAAINERDYNAAKAKMNDGDYEGAIAAFMLLTQYADAPAQIETCQAAIAERDYDAACNLMERGHFNEAIEAFEKQKDYSDSAEKSLTCRTALDSIDRTITFDDDEVMVFSKKSVKLQATVTAVKDTSPEKTVLKYVSSDTGIAKVSRDGTVTGVKAGEARIICTASDNPYVIGEVTVRVVMPVNKVTLDQKQLTLSIASEAEATAKQTLIATVLPEDAHIKTITWSTSNDKVATVDEAGVVRATGFGRAVITAASDDTSGQVKKASCTVSVVQAVTDVVFENAPDTIYIGKSVTIKAGIGPKDAADKKLQWISSDESVATVANGKVKGIASGTATITATASSGISAQFTATVKRAPTTFNVTATAQLIAKNHVGSHWSKNFSLDGTAFSKSTKVTAEEGQTITLECEIVENDDNPDWGGFSCPIELTDEILQNGYIIDRTVYVEENGGRYSGYCAEWHVVIELRP